MDLVHNRLTYGPALYIIGKVFQLISTYNTYIDWIEQYLTFHNASLGSHVSKTRGRYRKKRWKTEPAIFICSLNIITLGSKSLTTVLNSVFEHIFGIIYFRFLNFFDTNRIDWNLKSNYVKSLEYMILHNYF